SPSARPDDNDSVWSSALFPTKSMEALMTRLGMFRSRSHVFACLGVRRDGGGDPTERLQDKRRKVRAVGWQESARRSVTWRSVHFSTATCRFAQAIEGSALCAPCDESAP